MVDCIFVFEFSEYCFPVIVFCSWFPVETFLCFGDGGWSELKVYFLPFGGGEANMFVDLVDGCCLKKHVGWSYVNMNFFPTFYRSNSTYLGRKLIF